MLNRLATHHGGMIVLLAILAGVEGLGYLLIQAQPHLHVPLWVLAIPPVLFVITCPWHGAHDRTDARHELEETFGEALDMPELTPERCPECGADMTVGELHERICHQLQDHGKRIPCSSWHRVQHALAHATGCPPGRICRCDSLDKVFHDHPTHSTAPPLPPNDGLPAR